MSAAHVVLAVDDSLYDLELLGEALRHCSVPGVEMARAASAEQMREYFAAVAGKGPSLVLLDLQMPREDGFSALTWLRGQDAPWHRVPVIMMTTSHDYVEIRRAYDLGANSFLVKPTGFEELRAGIDDVARYWLARNRYA
jgi:DNA-binding response OmpR family regulator